MSWIDDYVEYVHARTDAPAIFKKFMGYAAVGGVLADYSYLDLEYGSIYPNFYMMLLGPSGKVRKSTCINHMKEIVTRVSPKILWSSNFSDEGLLNKLQHERTGMIIDGEFSKIASGFDKKFAMQSKAILTDIYECPEIYPMPVRAKESDTAEAILQPVLSIVTASTPEWLLEHASPEDVTGGFLGRFIMIYASKRSEKRPSVHDYKSVRDDLARRLYNFRKPSFPEEIRSLGPNHWDRGPMILSPEGRTTYDEWKRELDARIETSDEYQQLHGVLDRISDNVWKFAIIHTAMDLTRLISRDHVRQAIAVGEECIQHTVEILHRLLVVQNKKMLVVEKIIDFVRKSPEGKVPFRQICQRFHMTKKDLADILQTIVEMGDATMFRDGRRLMIRYNSDIDLDDITGPLTQ